MTPNEPADAVPEADRLEQQMPPEPDLRFGREHPPDRPEADTLEQEVTVEEGEEAWAGLDDDRVESLGEEDRPDH